MGDIDWDGWDVWLLRTTSVEADADGLASWLVSYIDHTVDLWQFFVAGGHPITTMEVARPQLPITDRTEITIGGIYTHVSRRSGAQKIVSLERLIVARIEPLAADRTWLALACRDPDFEDYYHELVRAVGDRYPETAEALRTPRGDEAERLRLELEESLTDVSATLRGQQEERGAAAENEEKPTRGDETASNVFTRRRDYWVIRYASGSELHLADSRGLRYIALLLARPYQEQDPVEMVRAVQKQTIAGEKGQQYDKDRPERESYLADSYPMLDDTSISDLKTILPVLEQQHRDAVKQGDPIKASEISGKITAVEKRLNEDTTPKGESRSFETAHDRARSAVYRAINRAIDRIASDDDTLGSHLEIAIRKHRGKCSYDPQPPVQWAL